MKKVAILTTFFEASSGYSLIAVAETQIKLLLEAGYDPAVIVQDNFRQSGMWREEMLDLRPVVPQLHLQSGIADNFEERVDQIYKALKVGLHDAEVCITHDIMLQKFYKEHNIAVRRLAKLHPEILWLHFLHSCPTPADVTEYPENCRYTPPPGYLVYPNASDKAMVCNTYGLAGQEQRVVPNRASHSIDPLAIWDYDKLTRDIVDKFDLPGGEVTAVYPVRLDRGKQPEKVIRLMAGVHKAGYDPRLLVIDWQSSGKHFQEYIDELMTLTDDLGIGGKVAFTSRLDDRANQGVPRHIVTELMDLSNIYVHPSRVETYSLVTHEAILRGKLAVLNHDFPAARELFGENAIYMDFGSDRNSRSYGSEEQIFWNNEAYRLIAELRQNRALWAQTQARREWSPGAMWRDFERLLYLETP